MKKELAVLLENKKIGVLSQDDSGRLSYVYDADYLAGDEHSMPYAISYSLPLSSDVYGDKATRSFFSSLLPDETQRERIAKRLNVSKNNPFSLLKTLFILCMIHTPHLLVLLPCMLNHPLVHQVYHLHLFYHHMYFDSKKFSNPIYK